MCVGHGQIADRSQPTYEELKRGELFRDNSFFFRSQPTYEELKLPAPPAAIDNNHRSQPTYEELKRFPGPSYFKGCCVLSLPMRN